MAGSKTGRPGSYEDWVLTGEDVYGGLSVPMVADWKDGRKLLVGWINGIDRYHEVPKGWNLQVWGGWLCFRELIQFPDGRLGSKWLEETPNRGETREYACSPDRPKPVLETNSHRDFFMFVLPIHKMFLRADAETVRELNPPDPVTNPVSDPVSDPVKIKWLELVKVLVDGPRTAAELRGLLAVSHRKFFRDNYINPAIRNGYVVPDEGVSLHNPYLRYFITQKGRDGLKRSAR